MKPFKRNIFLWKMPSILFLEMMLKHAEQIVFLAAISMTPIESAFLLEKRFF